jgi:hypothetical protein
MMAAAIIATPTLAPAQPPPPDLTGIWAVPTTRVREKGPTVGVLITFGSVDWAPLSAGAPESRTPPTYEEQRQLVEALVKKNANVGAQIARNAFRPPYTEAGSQAVAERPAADPSAPPNPYAVCRPRNLIGVPAGDFQIMQSKDRLLLALGNGAWRTIYLGGPKPDPLPSYAGYSWGRWVGRSLVVTTDNFLGETANGWPMSPQAKVIETFIPQPDGSLDIKTVYEDPLYLREPVGRYARLKRQPADLQIVITNCIENVEGDLQYRAAFDASGNRNMREDSQ